jgi:hypothetical protein
MYRVGKRKKRRLERPRRILEDNIRIGVGESDGGACNGLIWERWRAVVSKVMNLRVRPNAVSWRAEELSVFPSRTTPWS